MNRMNRRIFIGSALAAAAATSLSKAASAKPLAPFKLYDTHAHFYTNDAGQLSRSTRRARVMAPSG